MMADIYIYMWQLAPDSGMGVAIYGSGYKEGVFDKYRILSKMNDMEIPDM